MNTFDKLKCALIATTLMLSLSIGTKAQQTTQPQQEWEFIVTVHKMPTVDLFVNGVLDNSDNYASVCMGEALTFNVNLSDTTIWAVIKGKRYAFKFDADFADTHPLIVYYTLTGKDCAGTEIRRNVDSIKIYPSGTYPPITVNIPYQGEYNLTIDSLMSYCKNDKIDAAANIIVNPKPTMDMLPSYTVCVGDSINIKTASDACSGAFPMRLFYKEYLDATTFADAYKYPMTIPAGGLKEPARIVSTATPPVPITVIMKLDSLIDGNGCKLYSSDDITITVNPLPTIEILEDTVCKGNMVTIHTTGAYLNGTNTMQVWYTENGADPGISPLTIPNDNFASQANLIGNYVLFVDSLVDANGCRIYKEKDSVYVRRLPTVVIKGDELCQDDPIEVTFTGTGNNFTLNYKFTMEPDSDPDVAANFREPASIGLPPRNTAISTSILTEATNSPTADGARIWTRTFHPGTPGKFTFYLKSITDGECPNTNPNNPTWLWAD